MQRITGFNAIVHGDDRILILGSMPSVKSLEDNMYYANKTNRFWPMLSNIYGFPYQTIKDKYQLLEKAHIALWDSCHSCIRKGSMDSNIKDVIVNDIPSLLEANPSIQKILFNGRASYQTFKRYFPEIKIDMVVCPSTSAANAKFKMEDLISIYKEAGL
ncbi:MAG: DNA-deoxyinosine glycosylase [Holdemanella sp.]|nr:DNA-deoxyinosine glycosylase [Holdemanella sp.]